MSRGHDSHSRPNNQPSRTGRNKAVRDNRSRQLNPKDVRYDQSREKGHGSNSSSSTSDWRNQMKSEDAARIQSHADRTGRNRNSFAKEEQTSQKRANLQHLIHVHKDVGYVLEFTQPLLKSLTQPCVKWLVFA